MLCLQGGGDSNLEYTHLWTIEKHSSGDPTNYGYDSAAYGNLEPDDLEVLAYTSSPSNYFMAIKRLEDSSLDYYPFGDTPYLGMCGTFTQLSKYTSNDYSYTSPPTDYRVYC